MVCKPRIWNPIAPLLSKIFIKFISVFYQNNDIQHLQPLPAHRYMHSTLPKTAGIPKIPSCSFTPIHTNLSFTSIMPKLFYNCNPNLHSFRCRYTQHGKYIAQCNTRSIYQHQTCVGQRFIVFINNTAAIVETMEQCR